MIIGFYFENFVYYSFPRTLQAQLRYKCGYAEKTAKVSHVHYQCNALWPGLVRKLDLWFKKFTSQTPPMPVNVKVCGCSH